MHMKRFITLGQALRQAIAGAWHSQRAFLPSLAAPATIPRLDADMTNRSTSMQHEFDALSGRVQNRGPQMTSGGAAGAAGPTGVTGPTGASGSSPTTVLRFDNKGNRIQ